MVVDNGTGIGTADDGAAVDGASGDGAADDGAAGRHTRNGKQEDSRRGNCICTHARLRGGSGRPAVVARETAPPWITRSRSGRVEPRVRSTAR